MEDPVFVEVHKIDGPAVDTVEYRNIEGNIDDMRRIGDRADWESTWFLSLLAFGSNNYGLLQCLVFGKVVIFVFVIGKK